MNIRFEGKEIRQGNRFEYLGETVTGDDKSVVEVRRRIQVGANAWSNQPFTEVGLVSFQWGQHPLHHP